MGKYAWKANEHLATQRQFVGFLSPGVSFLVSSGQVHLKYQKGFPFMWEESGKLELLQI